MRILQTRVREFFKIAHPHLPPPSLLPPSLLPQEELSTLAARVAACEAASKDVGGAMKELRRIAAKVADTDGRVADTAGRLSSVAGTLPVLARQLSSLDARLSTKLETAGRALQALAGQLTSLGMMSKLSPSKNPLAGVAQGLRLFGVRAMRAELWVLLAGLLVACRAACLAANARPASPLIKPSMAGLWVPHCHQLTLNPLPIAAAPPPSSLTALGPNSEAIRHLEGKMEAVRTALAASVKLLLQEMSHDAAVTALLAASPALGMRQLDALAEDAEAAAGSAAQGAGGAHEAALAALEARVAEVRKEMGEQVAALANAMHEQLSTLAAASDEQ